MLQQGENKILLSSHAHQDESQMAMHDLPENLHFGLMEQVNEEENLTAQIACLEEDLSLLVSTKSFYALRSMICVNVLDCVSLVRYNALIVSKYLETAQFCVTHSMLLSL